MYSCHTFSCERRKHIAYDEIDRPKWARVRWDYREIVVSRKIKRPVRFIEKARRISGGYAFCLRCFLTAGSNREGGKKCALPISRTIKRGGVQSER